MKPEDFLVTDNWVGRPVARKEDIRLVRGEASYVDDLDMDCYHAAILRSPYPHARIKNIDTSRAAALPGVLGFVTGEEIEKQTQPVAARAITRPAVQYVMAVGKVRYVGEAVVAVVAVDAYIAHDALDLIDVDYELLQPVVRIGDAVKEDAPLVFEEAGSNILLHETMVHGDLEAAYQEADLTVKEKFHVHRYSSTPLETLAVIAKHQKGDDSFVLWANDQQHGRSVVNVCNSLGLTLDRLRLIVPDSGGGFGIKLALWPYLVIMCLLSKKVSKPVKWIQ
ncbi:MAG: molybdopterin cofactor-binding domain-containing protein, partial [bacterium]